MHFEVHAQLRKKISLRFSRERSWVLVVKIYRCREKIQKISGGTSKDVGSQFTDERKERKRPKDQRSSRERYLDRCTWRIQINRQIPTYRAPHSSNSGKSANAEWRGVKKKKTKKQNKNLCPPGRFTRARGEKLTPRNFAARGFKYREYHANIRSLKT